MRAIWRGAIALSILALAVYAAVSPVADLFMAHQIAASGHHRAGITRGGASMTVVAIGVLIVAIVYALRRLMQAREQPSPAMEDELAAVRMRWGAPALGAAMVSAAAVGALVVLERGALGGWTTAALVLVPVLPLSVAMLLELFVPASHLRGEVEDLSIRQAPLSDAGPVYLVRVAGSDTSVPKHVFDQLREGQPIGVLRTGGMFGVFLALTNASTGGPYR